jgi:hypothetical protein
VAISTSQRCGFVFLQPAAMLISFLHLGIPVVSGSAALTADCTL